MSYQDDNSVKQCKAMMENGERCTKEAIPESPYCAGHYFFLERIGKISQNPYWKEFSGLFASIIQQRTDQGVVDDELRADKKSRNAQVTSISLEELLGRFYDLGLLSHLTTSQIINAKTKIQENNQEADMLLYGLPDLVYGFDTEDVWDPSNYKEVINQLRMISRGAFCPDEVTVIDSDNGDGTTGDEFQLTFKFRGKKFQFRIKYNDDWFDEHLVLKINDTLKKIGVDGLYYSVDTNDQFCVLVFLTHEQFKHLKAIYPLRMFHV